MSKLHITRDKNFFHRQDTAFFSCQKSIYLEHTKFTCFWTFVWPNKTSTFSQRCFQIVQFYVRKTIFSLDKPNFFCCESEITYWNHPVPIGLDLNNFSIFFRYLQKLQMSIWKLRFPIDYYFFLIEKLYNLGKFMPYLLGLAQIHDFGNFFWKLFFVIVSIWNFFLIKFFLTNFYSKSSFHYFFGIEISQKFESAQAKIFTLYIFPWSPEKFLLLMHIFIKILIEICP